MCVGGRDMDFILFQKFKLKRIFYFPKRKNPYQSKNKIKIQCPTKKKVIQFELNKKKSSLGRLKVKAGE